MPAAPRHTARILDAALAVFLRQGFADGSMDEIAVEAGVARRTLFNQFESKEALFRSAVERFWDAMPVMEISTAEAALVDPGVGLKRMGSAIAEFWADARAVALVRLIIADGRRFPQLASAYLDGGKLPALAGLIAYLDGLKERGYLSIPDTDLAARQFVGLINEPLLWFRVIGLADDPPPERRRHVVDEAVRTFLSRYPVAESLGSRSTSARHQLTERS